MPDIAADEPPGMEELEEFVAAGRAWVAADDDGAPVAYLLAAVVDAPGRRSRATRRE